VLEPVVARYWETVKRLYFRGDAAFAIPEIYEFLEAEGIGYTIRFPANRVLQDRIGYLLKRPVGRLPHEVRRYFASLGYQAQSWKKSRRVMAKVEWHPGEPYPRVGFIVTNLARPAERVMAFYNQRGHSGAMYQRRQGRDQVDPPVMPYLRRQRRAPSASRPRLQPRQFHADAGKCRRRRSCGRRPACARPIKIGAKVVSHGRYVAFQLAEVAVSPQMFADILSLIARLRALPAPA
jgi:hypothetical protein